MSNMSCASHGWPAQQAPQRHSTHKQPTKTRRRTFTLRPIWADLANPGRSGQHGQIWPIQADLPNPARFCQSRQIWPTWADLANPDRFCQSSQILPIWADLAFTTFWENTHMFVMCANVPVYLQNKRDAYPGYERRNLQLHRSSSPCVFFYFSSK